jgi:hypothetical protein
LPGNSTGAPAFFNLKIRINTLKTLATLLTLLSLGATICLPGMASADYVQGWAENGLYQGNYQTWNKAEAFLLSDGNWTGTGLTITSGSGWTATLINPTYALATGNPFISSTQGNFYFTTSATDLTGPFSFDWVLSNNSAIVGVQRSIYTPGAGWSYTDFTATPPWENRAHAPLPPTALLLGTGLLGLLWLRRKSKRDHKKDFK